MSDNRTINLGTERLSDRPARGRGRGARPGDVARVALPSGRDRALGVLEVTGGEGLTADNAPEAA